MSSKTNPSLDNPLRKAGIRHFDVLIHDQPKEWLIKNFSQRADAYPVNVARLMRNIIWQTRERIVNGQKSPLKELIRTFWYISRVLSLKSLAGLFLLTERAVILFSAGKAHISVLRKLSHCEK